MNSSAGPGIRTFEKLIYQTESNSSPARPLGTLSGGELQRVRIAAALLDDPALLMLDEPSSHLDPPSAASLKELLFHLHQEHSLTLIVVSHDESFLDGLATHRLTLDAPLLAVA